MALRVNLFFFFFPAESCHVAPAGLEFCAILLPLLPACWNYRYALLYSADAMLVRSTNRARESREFCFVLSFCLGGGAGGRLVCLQDL